MPTYNPDESYQRDYTELDRRLAARRQQEGRRADEELASRGAAQGGARADAQRGVEGQINDLWHQGAQAIESRRFSAEEAGRQRDWQTGERLGSEAHQTALQQMAAAAAAEIQELVNSGQMDLQTANNEWQGIQNDLNRALQEGLTTGGWEHETSLQTLQGEQALEQLGVQGAQTLEQMGAQFGYSQTLQSQAEAAAAELQQLVQSGQMDLQTAQNEWQTIQSEMAQAHELTMQANQTALQQWLAQFDSETAMALQNDTQLFEELMANTNREWELENQTWQQSMWLLDAQLQLTLGGWDWNADGIPGGVPDWIVESSGEPNVTVGGEGGSQSLVQAAYDQGWSPGHGGVGTWFHPSYGTVSFAQMQQIVGGEGY